MKREKKKLLLIFPQEHKRSFKNGIYVRSIYVPLTFGRSPKLQDYGSLIHKIVFPHANSSYRPLSALIGLNGLDHLHLGPSSAHGPGAPVQFSPVPSVLLELLYKCLLCSCLAMDTVVPDLWTSVLV